MSYYLLYGLGLSNQSVRKYFEENKVKYKVYEDGKEENLEGVLKDVTCVVKSPGISNETKLIKLAKKKKVEIITDIELFYTLFKLDYLICVTGSNGKTTVSSLLETILKDDGFICVGNMGKPIFNYYQLKEKKFIVECSSYMLEYIKSFKPNILIITNIEEHHLDHHKTFNNYFLSKTKPLKNMSLDDYVIYPLEDSHLSSVVSLKKVKKRPFNLNGSSSFKYQSDTIFFKKEKLFSTNNLKVLGQHNITNVLIALMVLECLGIDIKLKIEQLLSFEPLPHRLELFSSCNYPSVLFVNDSKSTNVYSLDSAIETIRKKYLDKKIVLIVGGMKIFQDYQFVKNNILLCERVLCYGMAGIEFCKVCNNAICFPNLHQLVDCLKVDLSESNELVLFSPGAPSQDEFSSFEERGQYFKDSFK